MNLIYFSHIKNPLDLKTLEGPDALTLVKSLWIFLNVITLQIHKIKVGASYLCPF